jgi:hypothetical protein
MAKYTIDFDDAFNNTLEDLKETTDATTKADVIRRAVASYKVLKSESAPKDQKISITSKDGKILKDIVLP